MPDSSRAVRLSRTQPTGAVIVFALFASSILLLSLVVPLAVHTAAEAIIQIIS